MLAYWKVYWTRDETYRSVASPCLALRSVERCQLQLIFSLCASRLDDKDTAASEGSRTRDKRPEMWETNSIPCVYVAGGFFVSFSVLVRSRARANEEPMGEGAMGERERPLYSVSLRGRRKKGRKKGGGRKREGGEMGRVREGSLTLSSQSPSLFPFLAIPNPFRRVLLRLKGRLHSTPWDFRNAGGFSPRYLSKDDGNGRDNFTQKWDSRCSKFRRSYSNSSSVRFCTQAWHFIDNIFQSNIITHQV